MAKSKKEEVKNPKENVNVEIQVSDKNEAEIKMFMFKVDLKNVKPIVRCEVGSNEFNKNPDKYHHTIIEAQSYAKNELLIIKDKIKTKEYKEILDYINNFS